MLKCTAKMMDCQLELRALFRFVEIVRRGKGCFAHRSGGGWTAEVVQEHLAHIIGYRNLRSVR